MKRWNNLKIVVFSVLLLQFNLSVSASECMETPHIQMVKISAGHFLMGSNGTGIHQDERPAHKVTLTYDFMISAMEITNAQYEMFDPSHKAYRGKNGFSKEDNEAVVYVSYDDALGFCEWLSKNTGKSYRLPTEAEWEYACRAGSMGPYGVGDRALPKSMQKSQVHSEQPKPVSLAVGKSTPNAWGIFDMHGNVEEWCQDYYAPYHAAPDINPGGPITGETRVVRGGSHNTPVEFLRSSNRSALLPADRNLFTGFRVVEVIQESNLSFKTMDISKPKKWKEYNWKPVDGAVFMEPISFVTCEGDRTIEGMYDHNHCPTVTWLPNGDLMAAWFSTMDEKGREMTILQSRLQRGTSSWSEPNLFYKVADRNMTGSSLFFDEDSGVLYHFNGVEQAGTWKNLALVMRKSYDCGQSWSTPIYVNPEHEPGNQVITGTIKTKSGMIIQPCDATPTVRGGTILHVSSDEGKTWERSDEGKENIVPKYVDGGIGHRIAGIHACVVELEDGRLMALGRDNNIFRDGISYMPMSISQDGGKTWQYSVSCFPPISSGQRAVMIRLTEGPLLLISFTDARIDYKSIKGKSFVRNGKEYVGYGMFASLSFDDGKTWTNGKLLTDGKDRYLYGGAFTGWFKMDETHAEPKGYLAITQSPDGMIHLLSSALHYRFNLKWLMKE